MDVDYSYQLLHQYRILFDILSNFLIVLIFELLSDGNDDDKDDIDDIDDKDDDNDDNDDDNDSVVTF